jgi:hypothetical protein
MTLETVLQVDRFIVSDSPRMQAEFASSIRGKIWSRIEYLVEIFLVFIVRIREVAR